MEKVRKGGKGGITGKEEYQIVLMFEIGPHLNLQVFKKMHCTACKKGIEGNNYLATLNQQYHIGCARCSECNCQLDPKQPFYQNGIFPFFVLAFIPSLFLLFLSVKARTSTI